MPGADRILVFIPAYNCAPQVGRVLAQLSSVPAGTFAEVMVVDNGSADDTVAAARAAAQQLRGIAVRVVRNADNYNLGGSHKAAFAYAAREGFTHVVVLHGDDQADVADLLPLLRAGAHREVDALLGARFMRGSRLIGYSRLRTVGNVAFNLLFSLASMRRVRDLGSGLNVFSRAVFAAPTWQRYPDDLRFNVYLLLGLIDGGRSFRFFPISWREEDQRSNVRLVSQSLRTLSIAAEYLLHRDRFRSAEHRTVVRDAYPFADA